MKTIGAIAALAIVITLSSVDVARSSSFVATLSVSLSDSAPGANAAISVDYDVDSPHAMPAFHMSFIPPAFGVASDAGIPNGAGIGGVAITHTESLNNGPCSSGAFIAYDLWDATTDTSNTLPDDPRIPDPAWPGFADADSNGLLDAIDKYPNFLKTLYPGLTPRSRGFGMVDASVASVNRVVNVLVFDPGTALPGLGPIDPSLGYIVVVVFQDPTANEPGVVTARCAPYGVFRYDIGVTSNNPNTPANEAGFPYRTNPATDGAYVFLDYAQTVRDFDDDGIENTLDTCPGVATTTWNPRISDPVGDPDGDGIPGKDDLSQSGEQLLPGTGCDPMPLTAATDHDGDGFANREDNCPLIANDQTDTDGDAIGDACDVVDTAGDGHLHEVCVTSSVSIGSGGTAPTPACPKFVLDMDNDGFKDDAELIIGTGPNDPCGFSGWPADLAPSGVSANRVDLLDLSSFVAPVRKLNTSPGDPNYNARWDISPGGMVGAAINLLDMSLLVTVKPPMLEGPRAFNGPPCPYP